MVRAADKVSATVARAAVGDAGETVAVLGEVDPRLPRLAGHVLVAVEDDLRPKGRVPGHLDREMPPLLVQDVEGVMVDIGLLPGEVPNAAGRRALDVPHPRHRPGDQDQAHAFPDGVGRQILGGDLVLALALAAVDDRDAVGLGEAPQAATESPGHAHEMGVVQVRLGAAGQSPPPLPKPTRGVAQREVGVEDDAVYAVVAPLQEIAVLVAQPVTHGTRV